MVADRLTIFGIRNCDSVKKARQWLLSCNVPYEFHDFRTQGLPPASLDAWIAAVGWKELLNRRGTTFRQLPDAQKSHLDTQSARGLMLSYPTLIKRPVLCGSFGIRVGFDPDLYEGLFAACGD
ncbi:hypothetical protein AA101099_0872 [Neoasaia chiangmaiensis NBRC 101099]|uniref:Arsenate reductase n=2 Tax=Neoasaia chiangmaiensis TaxID=320497 RepID=A0A1U9KMI0_9PROT|nr:arsenate reductase [Neoasaia chiangmaiensis]AQS86985.1 arsenate reductase [Neoasaia chiangmaiensis]GBR37763.1 hypothetical protein AA101099_0872 [Neoasaia chiangmaiensis NBRC 101099]GEN15108.1 hypothetical protein NCH01_15390 [Neoasaia chiangmaiensis]